MHIFEQIDPLEEYLNSCREDGQSIALVPTMGGLHEGHLKLIDKAKECSDMVVVSVFVNPTQFAENEDFEAYPKTLSEDKRLLEAIKVEVMFVPWIMKSIQMAVHKTTMLVKWAKYCAASLDQYTSMGLLR